MLSDDSSQKITDSCDTSEDLSAHESRIDEAQEIERADFAGMFDATTLRKTEEMRQIFLRKNTYGHVKSIF